MYKIISIKKYVKPDLNDSKSITPLQKYNFIKNVFESYNLTLIEDCYTFSLYEDNYFKFSRINYEFVSLTASIEFEPEIYNYFSILNQVKIIKIKIYIGFQISNDNLNVLFFHKKSVVVIKNNNNLVPCDPTQDVFLEDSSCDGVVFDDFNSYTTFFLVKNNYV